MMQEENKKAPRGFCFLDILDRPYACTQTIGVCHAKTEVIHVAPTTPLFELRTRSQTCFFWLDFYATVVCIKRHDIPVSGPSVCQFLKAGGVLPFRFRRDHNASPAFQCWNGWNKEIFSSSRIDKAGVWFTRGWQRACSGNIREAGHLDLRVIRPSELYVDDISSLVCGSSACELSCRTHREATNYRILACFGAEFGNTVRVERKVKHLERLAGRLGPFVAWEEE